MCLVYFDNSMSVISTFGKSSSDFHFRIFNLEYVLIKATFFHILPRVCAHYNFILAYILPRVFAHYNFIFAYFTSSICSLHSRVIFIKGNDNLIVTFWKKTAFQWLFYSRPSNFTSFLVEGTRTFLERPFSLFWVTFLLTCYRLYFFSRGR